MHWLCNTLSWALALTLQLTPSVSALPLTSRVPHPLSHLSLRQLQWDPSQVGPALGSRLSDSSSIFGPTDPRFDATVERYDAYSAPQIRLVVQPGTEDDVATIVHYANANNIPFFAVNTGHGLTNTQRSFDGVQIDLTLLNNVSVSPTGQTALIQGGGQAAAVIDELWNQGYVTTTGSAGCPGIVGVGLGGGHGRLQGMYGMMVDNFVSLNVVLANGTAITVSEFSHPDLFWAMKGAGQNFGIVSSIEMRLYPRPVQDWSFRIYTWTEDKIETVFEELNKFHNNGNHTADMAINFGQYLMDPSGNPILWWNFVYSGSPEELQTYLDPFDAIPAITVESGTAPYNGISDATGTGLNSELCQPGLTHIHDTTGLVNWNVTANRAIYDLFAQNIALHPEWSRSAVVMEDYAHAGVLAVDPETAAYPWRERHMLNYISITYEPNPELDELAMEWSAMTRDLWNAGQPDLLPSTYVNYANGAESLESMYGYEPWRLERLRELKARYDPRERFSVFNPIPVGNH
ncbi:hypothetical protein BDV06DRAFT_225881 [Aspergillus oleicola]